MERVLHSVFYSDSKELIQRGSMMKNFAMSVLRSIQDNIFLREEQLPIFLLIVVGWGLSGIFGRHVPSAWANSLPRDLSLLHYSCDTIQPLWLENEPVFKQLKTEEFIQFQYQILYEESRGRVHRVQYRSVVANALRPG